MTRRGVNQSIIGGVNSTTIFFFMIILGAGIYTGTIQIPSGGHIVSGGLHVDGKFIKNSLSQNVILRGVNYARFIDSPYGDWLTDDGGVAWATWDASLAGKNLDSMKSLGCNTVRVTTTAQWWKEDTGGFRQRFKDFLTLADQRGLCVVLCYWRASGLGSQSNPYPPSSLEGGVEHANVIGTPQDFVDIWESTAEELKNYDNVIFELWNEPHDNQGFNVGEWMGVAQQCINAVRATGSNNLIIVEWGFSAVPDRWTTPVGRWSFKWVEDYPLTGSNVVYSMHLYWDRNNNTPDVTYPTLLNGYLFNCYMNQVLNVLNKPIFIGETGADETRTGVDGANEYVYFQNTLEVLDIMGVGYTAWVWGPGAAGYPIRTSLTQPLSQEGELLEDHLKGTSQGPMDQYTVDPYQPPPPPSDTRSFGYNGETDTGTFLSNKIAGTRFTCPEEGDVYGITARVYCYNENSKVRCSIYSEAGVLLGYTVEVPVTYTPTWTTFVWETSPLHLSAGANYYIMAQGTDTFTAIAGKWTGQNEVMSTSATYGTPPPTVSLTVDNYIGAGHAAAIVCNYYPMGVP